MIANDVAALPYDVFTAEEARVLGDKNALSFLHIEKSEIDFKENLPIEDRRIYLKAQENLQKGIQCGTFKKDASPCFYLYRLTQAGRVQTGIVCCTSIDDYIKQSIKEHEQTRSDKEKERIFHISHTKANTGPVYLAYQANEDIRTWIRQYIDKHRPETFFLAEDDVYHEVWVVDCGAEISYIENLFLNIDALYIADGHHRASAAVQVGLQKRSENPQYSGLESYNFFLSVLFSWDELKILDYNRVVKDLGVHSMESLMIELEKKFWIHAVDSARAAKPIKKHTFGMFIKNKWYQIILKNVKGIKRLDLGSRLDVSILQNHILEPLLGISDPRSDKRIEFVGGIRGLEILEEMAGDKGVAFLMYPTEANQLIALADNNQKMPPKSTWFEPKLRSGLFIHEIEET